MAIPSDHQRLCLKKPPTKHRVISTGSDHAFCLSAEVGESAKEESDHRLDPSPLGTLQQGALQPINAKLQELTSA